MHITRQHSDAFSGVAVAAATTAFAAKPAVNTSLFKFTPPDFSCPKHDFVELCALLAPEVTA